LIDGTARAGTTTVPGMNGDCLFCKIVHQEIPSTPVWSSERSYAFRDLNPQAPTHVLVVPRRHITSADTIEAGDAEDLADLFVAAQAVARQEGLVVDGTEQGGYRLAFNVGEISGNSVPHLHLHLLGGRRLAWPPG
jgi:histidine triad (HIT) family protein